ncbi:hypothetical protein HOY80DRAFT_485108 [Tuber brumale]|nr:hypothetical protein HOY80DRAFT_485108 [Tuber brumale]
MVTLRYILEGAYESAVRSVYLWATFNLRPDTGHQATYGLLLSHLLTCPLILESDRSDAPDHCSNSRDLQSLLHLNRRCDPFSIAVITPFHVTHETCEVQKILPFPLGARY